MLCDSCLPLQTCLHGFLKPARTTTSGLLHGQALDDTSSVSLHCCHEDNEDRRAAYWSLGSATMRRVETLDGSKTKSRLLEDALRQDKDISRFISRDSNRCSRALYNLSFFLSLEPNVSADCASSNSIPRISRQPRYREPIEHISMKQTWKSQSINFQSKYFRRSSSSICPKASRITFGSEYRLQSCNSRSRKNLS